MSDAFSRTIQRILQRILLTVVRGRIVLSDDSGIIQKHQSVFGPRETQDYVDRLGEFGLASMPPKDSDAIIVCIGGDRTKPMIIATGHKFSRPTGLDPGEVKIYDEDGRYVYLSKDGIVIEALNGNVTINNAATITANCTTLQVNGNVSVSGTVTATKEITSTLAGTHTLTQHKHGGVTAGAAQTATPTG